MRLQDLNRIIMDYISIHPECRFSKAGTDTPGSSAGAKRGNRNQFEEEVNDAFPDYPAYPPSEDIYSNYSKEEEVDIEQPYNVKTTIDRLRSSTQENTEDNLSGDSLDIPGAELDDYEEYIGSEDEENNYYSLGGDNHENLDENKGDDL